MQVRIFVCCEYTLPTCMCLHKYVCVYVYEKCKNRGSKLSGSSDLSEAALPECINWMFMGWVLRPVHVHLPFGIYICTVCVYMSLYGSVMKTLSWFDNVLLRYLFQSFGVSAVTSLHYVCACIFVYVCGGVSRVGFCGAGSGTVLWRELTDAWHMEVREEQWQTRACAMRTLQARHTSRVSKGKHTHHRPLLWLLKAYTSFPHSSVYVCVSARTPLSGMRTSVISAVFLRNFPFCWFPERISFQ